MNVGDRISVRPFYDRENPSLMAGTVIFIHPSHHYYTVRFPSGWCQSFREGFRE